MKYFQILLLLISFQSVSNASYYLGTRDICIEDFYAKGGYFYYKKSSTDSWYYTTDHNHVSQVYPSFDFDQVSQKCIPQPLLESSKISDIAIGFVVTSILIWALI